MQFKDLGIIEPILKALNEEKYSVPTSIQEKAIPLILNRKDVLGSAQTGTGKTAAFAIPILQKLAQNKESQKGPRKIRALKGVIAPDARGRDAVRATCASIRLSHRSFTTQPAPRMVMPPRVKSPISQSADIRVSDRAAAIHQPGRMRSHQPIGLSRRAMKI